MEKVFTNKQMAILYYEKFEKYGVNDIRLLEYFDDQTLNDGIGITHGIHKKMILAKASKFKRDTEKVNTYFLFLLI